MNIGEIGKKIGKAQVNKPSIFIIALIVVLALTIPGIPLMIDHVEPSLEKILPQETKVVKLMNDMRAQYGADMMYLVMEEEGVGDLRLAQSVKYTDILANKIRTDDYILDVFTIADIVKEHNNGYIPDSDEEIKQILRSDPRTGLYLNDAYDFTFMQIRSDTGAEAEVIKRVVDSINADIESVERYNPGIKSRITGFNAIDKATFEVIISDFQFITGFSFLFMLLFLIVYYKGSIKKVLYTISVIMISLLITLGLVGYIGLTITVVSMVAAAMIMALGISYGIHTVHRYFELRAKHRRKKSIILMQEELLRAMTGSSFTTSAGFIALLFGVIPAMKILGIILAMGIVITLMVTVLFVPVIIYTTDRRKIK